MAIVASVFRNVSSQSNGGALRIEGSSGTISQTTFDSVVAKSRGGAVWTANSVISMDSCNFTDVGLQYQDRDIDISKVTDRVGGAVAATGGSVAIIRCSFTRVSALPNDLQLSSCAKVRTQHIGVT